MMNKPVEPPPETARREDQEIVGCDGQKNGRGGEAGVFNEPNLHATTTYDLPRQVESR